MANAVAELKNRGFAKTRSNDEAGVASAIHRYVLENWCAGSRQPAFAL